MVVLSKVLKKRERDREGNAVCADSVLLVKILITYIHLKNVANIGFFH